MFSSVMTAVISGMNAKKVIVETDVSEGMPMFSMVGYLGSEVREAQERVRTAIKNLGYPLPVRRITVSLSPADLRKGGSGFDLPIALSVMAACGYIPCETLQGILVTGELGLDGKINGVRGVLEIASCAARFGCHTCIVPNDNLAEGSLVRDAEILGADDLRQVISYLCSGRKEILRKGTAPDMKILKMHRKDETDFSHLRGQQILRRASEIAVSGGHNLLLIGPPGSGKSMTAKCIRTIMPDMSMEEAVEVTRIYSIAGELDPATGLMTDRPFRAPHHSVTRSGMAGGGLWPRPGEISLAHRGILYLDELPEYSPDTLELLRGPLEDGRIVISRSSGSYLFPADFQLIASMNPCRCGFYPDRTKCRCTSADVKRYLSRISNPLLDRIDLCVEARQATFGEISGSDVKSREKEWESSGKVRSRVESVIRLQRERYRDEPFSVNARIPAKKTEIYCALGEREDKLMKMMYERLSLTGRSFFRILRVARTIADMEGSERILEKHLTEAAAYRMIDQKYWSL